MASGNPLHACAARVIVLSVCVCLSFLHCTFNVILDTLDRAGFGVIPLFHDSIVYSRTSDHTLHDKVIKEH